MQTTTNERRTCGNNTTVCVHTHKSNMCPITTSAEHVHNTEHKVNKCTSPTMIKITSKLNPDGSAVAR